MIDHADRLYLFPQLTALLSRLDDLAATSAAKVETAANPTQGAFYCGVMFGAETVRDKIAAILAEAQRGAVSNSFS